MNFTGYLRRAVLCAAALLLLGPQAAAQSTEKDKKPAMTKEEKAFALQVNAAIDKGVAYLRKLQAEDGSWPRPVPKQRLGATSLAALALLEAGAKANDPAIVKAADFVRQHCINETYNYSVSLAVMFLDRLGDPQDVPFIQSLGVRLLAAQTLVEADKSSWGQAGGWGYDTPAPSATEVQRLEACRTNRKPFQPPAKGAEKRANLTFKDLPKDLQARITALYKNPQPPKPGVGPVDNSNTQFALIALWVARRHGVWVNTAFLLAEQRLRQIQIPPSGFWTYRSWKRPAGMPAHVKIPANITNVSAQMTCCGLIGIGLAYGVDDDPKSKRNMSKDRAIELALKYVGSIVGYPATDPAKIPRLSADPDKVFYTLWTLERMAVLYDLKMFGKKDWYKWGAQILVANQGSDGSWRGAHSEGGCDTGFVLLFLKRANFTSDMTERIKKDPRLRPPIREVISDKSSSLAPRVDPGEGRGRDYYRRYVLGPGKDQERGEGFALIHAPVDTVRFPGG